MAQFLKKYFSSLYSPLLWTIFVGTLCCLPGSMLPNEKHFVIPEFDKIVHITFFGGFVFFWNLYYAGRASRAAGRMSETGRLLRIFFFWYVLGNVYGIGIEYIQKYWIPGRDYDLADMIADMIGAGLAYGISNMWLIRVRGASADKKK